MPSRWLAPKLAKMRQPYTDHERMIMGRLSPCPPPAVLDEIAERWMYAGWDPGNICPGCRLTRTVKDRCPGRCHVELFDTFLVIAGPCGWFRKDDTGVWELVVRVEAAPDAPAPRAHGRYQHGSRVMREQGLSGTTPRKRKRPVTRVVQLAGKNRK